MSRVSFPGLKQKDIELVENAIGINPVEAIDRVESGALQEGNKVNQNTSVETESKNKVDLINGEKVLQTTGELEPENLAHETVHADMIDYSHEGINIYGNDLLDQRLYAEFAAHTAQDIIGNVDVGGGDKMSYALSYMQFNEVKEQALEDGLPDEDRLFDQYMARGQIQSSSLEDRFTEAAESYIESREQTLAAYAASQYREENNIDVQEVINPDEETYNEIVSYIKESEEDLL